MISKKNLVLVGMMGSGKSTIGKILAQRLNYNFIDTDHIIEDIEKTSIKKIFETKGEKYFRSVEEKLVINCLKDQSQVIALGGGSFLNLKIRNSVLRKNISIWLNWSSEKLIKRIIKNDKRPLVKDLSRNDLHNMIEARSTTYRMAKYKIDCDKLIKSEIIKKILNIYKNE